MSVNADDAANSSQQTFLSALVLNATLLGIEIAAFVVLRNRRELRRVYAPRSFLLPPRQRFEATGGFVSWLPKLIFRSNKHELIAKNGLDSHLFIRLLEMFIVLFTGCVLIASAVLMPIDSVKIDGGHLPGLDMFTFGSVAPTQHLRYIAHLVCAWAVTALTIFLIRRELRAFISLRHAYLASPERARLAKARTVLIIGVPKEMLTEAAIRDFCQFVPDGIRRVWVHRAFKPLLELHERRVKLCDKLEAAESKVLRKSIKADVAAAKTERDTERLQTPIWRPKHSESKLPCLGRKVDSIDMCKVEIAHLNGELDELRGRELDPLPTVFIECNTPVGALTLVQVAPYHLPNRMTGRYLNADPDDLIWGNLDDDPVELTGRRWLTRAAAVALVLFYSIITAFVGGLSNVSQLCSRWSWLQWLCNLPTPVPGIIQGILPPALLALCFLVVPIILRALAVYAGAPSHTIAEKTVAQTYFAFLLFNGFLVLTVSSGLTAALPAIAQNPGSVVPLLASNLPKASIFFLTYVIATGLSGSAAALLRAVPLILSLLKHKLLGSTPRKVFKQDYILPSVKFGQVLPSMTFLAVIALSYSIIAPVINILALIAVLLLAVAWKYLLLFVFQQPHYRESMGDFYLLSLWQLFSGLIIGQLCLAGLLFLARDENNEASSFPLGICMIVLVVITLMSLWALRATYLPLIRYLPMSLAIRQQQDREIRRRSRLSALLERTHLGDKLNGGPSPSVETHAMTAKPAGTTPETDEADEDQAANAFYHPALWQSQRPIWIPRDDPTKGHLAAHQLAELREAGVEASSDGAMMDARGHVEVARGPPETDWSDWRETEEEKQA